jgi:hypothetical protein
VTAKPCAIYIGGVRVDCALLDFVGLPQARWNEEAGRAAAELGAKLAMTRLNTAVPKPDVQLTTARIPSPVPFSTPVSATHTSDSVPEGWIPLIRGYARPEPVAPEVLTPLTEAHHAAMRGLYGLFAGAFPGMLAREDPSEWETRLNALPNPLGIFEGERLLLWLAERDGYLVELSAAPDALERIPGALAAANVERAPAPILGVPAERVDETVWLRLIRPFSIPGARIETPDQLARALFGAVQWD